MEGRIEVVICSSNGVMAAGVELWLNQSASIGNVHHCTSLAELASGDSSLLPYVIVIEGHSHQEELTAFLEAGGFRLESLGGLILVTSGIRPDEVLGFLRRGVYGIVTSDCVSTDVCLAVDVVSNGGCYIERRLLDQLAEAFVVPSNTPGERDARFKLTSRESEILDLICRGCSNLEIATQLHVSPRTVKYHVSNVLDKLDARDRSEAMAIALGRRQGNERGR